MSVTGNINEEKILKKTWIYREENMKNPEIPEITKIYPTLPSMIRKFDKLARKDYFQGNSEIEFRTWQQKSKTTLKNLLGLDKMESCEGWSKMSSVEELEGGIRREQLYLETEPDVWVPIYILYPKNSEAEMSRLKTGKSGAKTIFLCPPGHGGGGKYSIAGLREYEAVEKSIDHYNYDIGMQVAKEGHIAVCPDIRGFGEMREEMADALNPESFMKGDCYWLSHMGEPLGIPVLGMLVWDLQRILDYLDERFFGVDVSCIGFSGGGMQSLYLAALDDRIKSVLLSGYMYGVKDSLLKMNRNCSCNYVPHLWEHFDLGDIASLICPRPLLIQSGREDRLNGERGLKNVSEQVEIIEGAYGLMHQEKYIRHEIFEGPHGFNSDHLKNNLKFLLEI